MAVVTEVTISTGSTVRTGSQAREVGIALTYRLEREDSDVMQVVREKAAEVARAHQVARKSIRDEQMASKSEISEEAAPPQDAQVLADEEEVEAESATGTQIKAIEALARASPLGEAEFEALLQERFGCSVLCELSRPQAAACWSSYRGTSASVWSAAGGRTGALRPPRTVKSESDFKPTSARRWAFSSSTSQRRMLLRIQADTAGRQP